MSKRERYLEKTDKHKEPTKPSAEVEKKLLKKIRVQPQAWQVLWVECGMPQPASVLKVTLQKMVEHKQVDFKFISGTKYYFKK